MKRKTVGLLLALMTMTELTSCGTKNEIAAVAMDNDSVVTIEQTTGLIVEEDAPVEPIYTEQQDLFLADNYIELNKEKLETVDRDTMESTYEKYALSDTVNVYNYEGTWVGYSKPDIEVLLFGTNDKWAEVSFLKTVLYVPKSEFSSVATPKAGTILYRDVEPETEEIMLAEAEKEVIPSDKKETDSKPKTKTPATTEPEVAPVTTEPEVVESEPAPVVESTKYTPEEAIAVYRSIMEANGIQWDPSIKEFASWGTGWIYLTKGQPEQAGNSSVESFRMGSNGKPWTKYYLEVTGSDENAVYYTKWHCN